MTVDAHPVKRMARKLLVTIGHRLTHRTLYRGLQAQTFVRKLQAWASRIGRAQLPAASSAEFVRQQLRLLGLEALANRSRPTSNPANYVFRPRNFLQT